MFELGREVTRAVNGKDYTFGRLERRLVEDFRDWVKGQIGDPFATLERFLGKLPGEEVSRVLRDAEDVRDQLQSFSLACPLAQRFLKTERGLGQLAYLMLRAKHPQITPDEAFAVAMQLGADEMASTIQTAQGRLPNGAAAVPPPEGVAAIIS